MRFHHIILCEDGIEIVLHLDGTPRDPRDHESQDIIELVDYSVWICTDALMPLTGFGTDMIRVKSHVLDDRIEAWLADNGELILAEEVERQRDRWEAEREDAEELRQYDAAQRRNEAV